MGPGRSCSRARGSSRQADADRGPVDRRPRPTREPWSWPSSHRASRAEKDPAVARDQARFDHPGEEVDGQVVGDLGGLGLQWANVGRGRHVAHRPLDWARFTTLGRYYRGEKMRSRTVPDTFSSRRSLGSVPAAPRSAGPAGPSSTHSRRSGRYGHPAAGLFFSTTRHRAKKLTNPGVASRACTQAFGTHAPWKRLEDKPLAAPRFSADP